MLNKPPTEGMKEFKFFSSVENFWEILPKFNKLPVGSIVWNEPKSFIKAFAPPYIASRFVFRIREGVPWSLFYPAPTPQQTPHARCGCHDFNICLGLSGLI